MESAPVCDDDIALFVADENGSKAINFVEFDECVGTSSLV